MTFTTLSLDKLSLPDYSTGKIAHGRIIESTLYVMMFFDVLDLGKLVFFLSGNLLRENGLLS